VAERRKRERYRPGVGVLLLNPRNELFVAQRVDFKSDAWQMPQGGIDKGETPEQAAWRELKEETGTDNAQLLAESRRWFSYDLPPDLAAQLWRGRYRGQRQKWFAFRFLGGDHEIDIATDHPEFSAWKWVQPDRAIELIVPFKRQLYREVFDEFRDLLGA
jgi:putative (di)nucleoside polyphosphate hydrolase